MKADYKYRFLPFRFERKHDNVLLVNDIGYHHFISKEKFNDLINYRMDVESDCFKDIASKWMVYTGDLPQTIEAMSIAYRTKKQFLYDFTSLHMFEVTRRCNQKCKYCHISSCSFETQDKTDMDIDTARRCTDMAFKSPSPNIKIEFQGGEPLLAFDIVKEIVNYSNILNVTAQKNLEFVICTNLTCLTNEIIDFIKGNNIVISTSLDGPKEIHDTCRILSNGQGSYENVIANLSKLKEQIGIDKISALMTVTSYNISRLHEVVNEYVSQGFNTVFLRMIHPFGNAKINWSTLNYNYDSFAENYQRTLDYIIRINLDGVYIKEFFATLLLSRILTPFSTGFVDLQSPAGNGISGVVYDITGDVYVSDEARMLFRTTGDKTFCIGNVNKDCWENIFKNSKLRNIISSSCIEAIPGCAWCVYQPYCGGDPVGNYAQQGNMIGNRCESEFCKKHRKIFDILFKYIEEGDPDIMNVFWSWITNRDLNEVRISA